MTTRYISTTGSDTTGDGTSGNPYATVDKCIAVGANGDTIKALTGTYTITSTTNVTKQVTITSNSGVKTDVVLNASTTIFNIQESNVTISNMTLQTSNVLSLVTIDRMSTGTTVPTFWTNNSVTGNNLKYVSNCLTLNGSFSVNSNVMTRMSGTSTATLLNVYSTRGSCSINSNTITDSNAISKVINVTQNGSGSYLDRCNSKGGTLTINANTVDLTHASQLTYFYYQDYFNQYSYGTIGSDSQYNINTKLSFVVSSNTVTSTFNSIFSNLKVTLASDFDTFSNCQINGNNISNTNYGALHLDKNIDSTAVTINTSIPRFKIYSNILDTIPNPSFDTLSVDATNSCVLCFSLKRKFSTYTGPLLQIVRSSDQSIQNFYGNTSGKVLNTSADLTGTSLDSWLGGATGYTYAWYNQSPNRLTGTECALSTRPDWTTWQGYPDYYMIITKDINGYYFLDGTRVNGSSIGPAMQIMSYIKGNTNDIYTQLIKPNRSLTFSFKNNTILSNGANVIMGGGTNVSGKCMGIGLNRIFVSGVSTFSFWDYSYLSVTTNAQNPDGKCLTVTYNNSTVETFLDSTSMGTLASTGWNPEAGNYFTINNAFAVDQGFRPRCSFYNLYIFNSITTGSDKTIMETF